MRDEEPIREDARARVDEDARAGCDSRDDALDARRTSRRRFTKTVAAALVAAPLAARLARAQTPPTTREPAAPPKPAPSPAPQQRQPQPPSPVALAYVEMARARFGDKLSDEELTRLRRNFEGKARTSDALSKVKLQNGDEPDFVFSA